MAEEWLIVCGTVLLVKLAIVDRDMEHHQSIMRPFGDYNDENEPLV